MIPRIPEDCRQAGSRLEDAIEGGGMDTEGASDLADGLSFLNEPISEDSLLLVHLLGAPEENATFLSLGATRSRALPDEVAFKLSYPRKMVMIILPRVWWYPPKAQRRIGSGAAALPIVSTISRRLRGEQRQRYGRFHGEVNSEDLSRYFHLDDSDCNLIAIHRGNHNRLGFAVQLCTVRYLGAFPEDLTETLATVVSILGRQLDIEDTTCFGEYCSSRQRWDHTARIRERGGYSDYSDVSLRASPFFS
jgi:hypothetical protein